jgi:hypothetical protein
MQTFGYLLPDAITASTQIRRWIVETGKDNFILVKTKHPTTWKPFDPSSETKRLKSKSFTKIYIPVTTYS